MADTVLPKRGNFFPILINTYFVYSLTLLPIALLKVAISVSYDVSYLPPYYPNISSDQETHILAKEVRLVSTGFISFTMYTITCKSLEL